MGGNMSEVTSENYAVKQEDYPHVNHLHAVMGSNFYLIGEDGRLEYDEAFTKQFKNELLIFDKRYKQAPQKFQLGYFMPAWPKIGDKPWMDTATLVLNKSIIAKLSSFETAMGQYLKDTLLHQYPVAKEMSAYSGMRRLIAYGSMLSYFPVVSFDEMNEPIVVNLLLESVSGKFNEFADAMREKLLDGELFSQCKVKPFLDELMASNREAV